MTANEIELKSLKESLQDTQPVGAIVTCCRTLDQVSFRGWNYFDIKQFSDLLMCIICRSIIFYTL